MPALGARVLSACSPPEGDQDADCGSHSTVYGAWAQQMWWTRFTGAPPPPPDPTARAPRARWRGHTGTTHSIFASCTSCTVYSQLRHTEITPRLGPRGLRGVGYVRTGRLVCRRDESRLGAADDLLPLGRTTSSCSSGADERRLGAKSASRSVTTTASAPSNESNART